MVETKIAMRSVGSQACGLWKPSRWRQTRDEDVRKMECSCLQAECLNVAERGLQVTAGNGLSRTNSLASIPMRSFPVGSPYQ